MILMCACSVASYSVRPHGLTSTRLLCPRDFPGKNTGVGCSALLQEISLTQRSNLCLLRRLHCGWILYRGATGKALPPQQGYSTFLHKGFYKPSPPSSLQPCNPPLHNQQMTLPTSSQKNQHKGSPLPLSFVCLSLSPPPSPVLNHHIQP